jgi:thiamine-phosphate pyrophosphorylase
VTRGISGLYAVTPDVADTPRLIAMVQAALAGGARLLQYRNKPAAPALRLAQARALLELCRKYRASFIINDHLDLALAVNADGLHLGADDGSLAAARAQLGPARLLGASCYDRLELALEAARLGADYVAFGSFYPSRVKPGAVRAPLSLLREARRRLSTPVVAIGGITHENAPQLIAAGAHSLAVVTALFDAKDVGLAARRFNALFAQPETATRLS